MKDILKYRTGYRNTIRHLDVLFYDLIKEEEVIAKRDIFKKLNMERKIKLKGLESNRYKILKKMYITEKKN